MIVQKSVTALVVVSTFLLASSVQAQPQPEQPEGNAAAKAEVQALWEQAQHLRSEGKLEAAIETTHKMLAKERKLYDRPIADIAVSLALLAELQKAAQDFPAAEESLKERLAICVQVFGERDSRTTDAHVELEDLQLRQKLSTEQRKRLADAEQLHVQGRQAYGEGKTLDALELEKQILKVHRELLGHDHLDVATTCSNIAYIYSEADVWGSAEQFYREAVRIRRQQLGTSHPKYSKTLDSLADVLRRSADQAVEREQFAEAVVGLAEALAIRASRHGTDDWRTRELRVELTHAVRLAALTTEQRKELQQATEVNEEAVQLYGEEKYEEAAEKLDEALGIRRKLLGVEDPQSLTSVQNCAITAAELGQDDKAEELFREVTNVRYSLFGTGHAATRDSMERLANHLERVAQRQLDEDQFDQAIIKRREIVQLRTILLGQNDWRVGDARRALKHAEILAGLTDEQRKELQTADQLNQTTASLNTEGKSREALVPCEQALEIKKKVLGEEHPDYAASLNNLGGLYQSMGDYARAEPLYRQSLEIRKKVLGQEHPQFAASLNNLAVLYESMGDYARAEPLYRQSLEIMKKVLGEEHPDYAGSLNNLAVLYESMGDYARAEPLYRQSLEIRKKALGEEHPAYAGSLNNLALLYKSMGDYAGAEPLHRQALEIGKKSLGEEHPAYATCLNRLADLYLRQGDYARAEPLYRQSLEIIKKAFGEEHPEYAYCLHNLAVLYMMMGDYAPAEPLCTQALEIEKKARGEEQPAYAYCLHNLAVLYMMMGDYARAEPLILQTLRTARTSLEATALIQSERQQLVMAQGLRNRLDNYLSLATVAEQHQEQAFREVLAWKGATLVRQRQMHKVPENANVAPLFKKLQQTATRLASLSRMVPEPQQYDAWRRQIGMLTAEKEELEVELSQQSSEFREAKKQVTLEDMLAALPKDAALVDFLEYTRFNPHLEGDQQPRWVRSLLAFVVRGSEPIVLLDLGPVAPVSEAIDTWRQTFGTSRDGVAAGRLLRERIWAPVEKHLDDSKLVLVSSDGVLGRLPFGALPGKQDGTYLLEDYRLAMLPVPQLLPALVSRSGHMQLAPGLLVMGDVDYDADPQIPLQERARAPSFSTAMVRGADTHFSHLPGTVGEIATIKELFTALFQPKPDAIRTLSQAEATEQQFYQAASRFPSLHLATHGFFAAPERKSALAGNDRDRFNAKLDREQLIRSASPGLLSGLVFSGANRKPEVDKDDGILTADEIAALSLEGVDLVVLSACETGLGEVAGGEGVLGVQRAFQVAGARSTVASLWQVGDIATRLLMKRFYRNYWEKKMSKLDALREAQLYLLNHPDLLNDPKAVRGVTRTQPSTDESSQRLSPQFWAAFQLSGDWR